LIAGGHSNREIAEQLTLSIRTIETHRQRIMNKLDIHSVAGLTKYSIAEGITHIG
jgi:DNA-binding NarL/FixJ family response regulator